MLGSLARASRPFPIVVPLQLLSLLLAGCGSSNIPTYEEQAKAARGP